MWQVRMRWTEHVASEDEKSNTCYELVEKPEGERQLGGARRTRTVLEIDLKKLETWA